MYYLFIMRQVICWFVYIGNWFVYIGKNPRFAAFLDSNLHTRLAIVTENELGLPFPTRNLPKKFHPDPSTFYLVIAVTNKQTNKQNRQDRQTDRQTNAGDYIIPRESFRGDKNDLLFNSLLFTHFIGVYSATKTYYFTHLGLILPSLFNDYAVSCGDTRSRY